MWPDAEIVKMLIEAGPYGVAGLFFIAWMTDRFLLVRDLRKLNDRMINAFDKNTEALVTLKTLIEGLCARI